jgi:thiosulfate dehydrogenase
MNQPICLLAVVAFLGANVIPSRGVLAADLPQVNLAEWQAPDISAVGDDEFGKLVKYGYALMTDTANQIGPTVSDPAKRFTGNNLTCQNCHLNAGIQAYAMPLVGVWGQFPQYRGREGEIGTIG